MGIAVRPREGEVQERKITSFQEKIAKISSDI